MTVTVGIRVDASDAFDALREIEQLDGDWLEQPAHGIRVLAERYVGKRTRLLVHSIRVLPFYRNGRLAGFSIVAGDDWVIDYASHHEEGTRFQEPRLYMTTALQEKLPEIRAAKRLVQRLRRL